MCTTTSSGTGSPLPILAHAGFALLVTIIDYTRRLVGTKIAKTLKWPECCETLWFFYFYKKWKSKQISSKWKAKLLVCTYMGGH